MISKYVAMLCFPSVLPPDEASEKIDTISCIVDETIAVMKVFLITIIVGYHIIIFWNLFVILSGRAKRRNRKMRSIKIKRGMPPVG